MKFKIFLILLTFSFSIQLNAQEEAKIVLKQAYKQAKAEDKNVLLIFHA